MRADVIGLEVMGIVGNDERDAGFLRHAADLRHGDFVLIEMVVLHLEEEIVFSEQILVFVGEAARIFVAVGEERFVDIAAQAGGERDQAF